METVGCNLCKNDNYKVLWFEGAFQVVKCKRCNLIYTRTRYNLEELKDLYSERYFTAERRDLSRYRERNLLYKISRYKKGGRILDVGCAEGDFLFEVKKKLGFDTYGIEISEYAANCFVAS